MKQLLVVLLILVMAGCSTTPQLEKALVVSPVLRPTESSLPYPPPVQQEKSHSQTLASTPIPTPISTKGAVTGQLINRKTGEPLDMLVVYLGEITDMQPGSIRTLTIKQQDSPHTAPDKVGRFAFLDLPPGTYPLILWSPMHSRVVSNPQTSQALLVIVKAGTVTKLGRILVSPP